MTSVRLFVVLSVLAICSCGVTPSDDEQPVYSIEGRSVQFENGLFIGDDGQLVLVEDY